MRQMASIFSSEECVICLEQASNIVFLPCSHVCTCQPCSDMIDKAKMTCPLCRSVITARTTDQESTIPTLQRELDDFAQRKEEYVKQLKSSCAKNAGFTGNSKLAKSVGRACGSELEERRLQNIGTDRFGGMKAEYTVNDNQFTVKYKVQGKRKHVEETYAFFQDWEKAKDSLLTMLDGERISTMDICIYYPEYFWMAKYYKQMDDLETVGKIKRR